MHMHEQRTKHPRYIKEIADYPSGNNPFEYNRLRQSGKQICSKPFVSNEPRTGLFSILEWISGFCTGLKGPRLELRDRPQ